MRYFAAINPVFWHSQPDMRVAGIAYPSVIDSDCWAQGTNILKVFCLPSVQYSSTREIEKEDSCLPMATLRDEMQKEGRMTGYCDLFKTSECRANAIARAGSDWQKKAGLFDWLSDYNQTLRGHALVRL
jgi:hypothetical protein